MSDKICIENLSVILRDQITDDRDTPRRREPVDEFFDKVMVNTEDAGIRANRHALLARVHHLMNQVAELARLAK